MTSPGLIRPSFGVVLARLIDSSVTLKESDLLRPSHWELGQDARLREDLRFRQTPWGRWMRAEDLLGNDALHRELHAQRRGSANLNESLDVVGGLFGRKGGELAEYTRHLEPVVDSGVPHWLWTTAKPVKSMLNFWLALDGKTFPADVRTDLGWSENASRPLSAEDLLGTAVRLVDGGVALEERGREIGRPVMQGASAISAGFLGAEADRRSIQVRGFRLLQLASLDLPEPPRLQAERRGIARKCGVCGHAPGMHKCCPSCGAHADGEPEIETTFGFRRLRSSDGTPYETPQPWCRACRQTRREAPSPESEEIC